MSGFACYPECFKLMIWCKCSEPWQRCGRCRVPVPAVTTAASDWPAMILSWLLIGCQAYKSSPSPTRPVFAQFETWSPRYRCIFVNFVIKDGDKCTYLHIQWIFLLCNRQSSSKISSMEWNFVAVFKVKLFCFNITTTTHKRCYSIWELFEATRCYVFHCLKWSLCLLYNPLEDQGV